MNWRKSVILKKAVRYGFGALRLPYSRFVSEKDYHNHPLILANSFPKSGTHLLVQILQAIPDIRDWGLVLASTPSFTMREISDQKMAKNVQSILPGELVIAHLFFSKKVAVALAQKKAIHYFIYRDPRDVVVSGAYYVTYMNRWHRLHKYFKHLPDMESRIQFSIKGAKGECELPFDYPTVRERFERYKKWIYHHDVLSLKFEEIIGSQRESTVRRIVEWYVGKSKNFIDEELLVQRALSNMNPQRSHTFREGTQGSWKKSFSEDNRELFKSVAGELLIELGYEEDYNW